MFATGGEVGRAYLPGYPLPPGFACPAGPAIFLVRTRLGLLLKERSSAIKAWVVLGAGEMRRKRSKRQGAAEARPPAPKRDSDRKDDRRQAQLFLFLCLLLEPDSTVCRNCSRGMPVQLGSLDRVRCTNQAVRWHLSSFASHFLSVPVFLWFSLPPLLPLFFPSVLSALPSCAPFM